MRAVMQENENDRLLVLDGFLYKDFLKAQAGAKWKPLEKGWSIPITLELVEELQKRACTFEEKINFIYQDKKKCLEQATISKFEEKVVAKEPMPIKAKPYDHQVRGYNIACDLMGLFLKG